MNLARTPHPCCRAGRRPRRGQARRRRAHLRPARRAPARHVAGLLASAWVLGPATASGSCSPTCPTSRSCYYGVLRAGGVVVPMNVLLKRREVDVLPERPRAPSCCSRGRTSPRPHRPAPRRPEPSASSSSPASSSSSSARPSAADRGRRRRRRRHRGDPLHVGHDRHAEGRRADARQPDPQRRGSRGPVRARRGRGHARRAAAVSFLRPDVRPERDDRRRRHADADPAIRSGQGAGDHPARPGQRLPGRADDVRRDAPLRRARRIRHLLAASCARRAARRCRSSSCAASRRRSAARSWRATGSRRPRRWRRSTTPTASASRDRSAPRSRASR